MTNVQDRQTNPPRYELKGDLARFSLSSASQDGNQKLAWTNSICLLFLLIGLVGARRGLIALRAAPPLEEAVPVILQPVVLPPQATAARNASTAPDNTPVTPVAVVIPQTPNIRFSVPTIGSLVVPAALAAAPPLEPMQVKAPVAQIGAVSSTGGGGDRPEPPYPKLAQQQGEQGTVVLLLQGDGAGNVLSVEIKTSSGYPLLDRATVDFIKRHWRLPTDAGSPLFQTSITYELQL